MPLGVTFRSMSAASPLAAWKKIASQSLGVAASSISFTGIASTYKMFRVTAYLIKDATPNTVNVRFNNDSGSNYTWQNLSGSNTSVSGSRNTQTHVGILSGGAVEPGEAATVEFVVGKQLAGSPAMVISKAAVMAYTGGTPVIRIDDVAAIWNNTADLISRIDLISSSGNFDTGTVCVLEGV